MSNGIVLEEMEAWADSVRAANQAANDSIYNAKLDSIKAANQGNGDSLTSVVQDSVIPFSEKKLPGVREESPLDYAIKGIDRVGKMGTGADMLASILNADDSAIPDVSSDYSRAVIANTIGMPIDAANTLLSLLGLEMSNEPFGGSRSIKSFLDYISEEKFSDKYIAPPPVY